MKRILLLLLLSVCLPQFMFSQSDFRKGFLIKLNGDTIFGLLNYTEGSKSFKICTYKESKTVSSVNYTPVEITGYGYINDRCFESKKIKDNDRAEIPVFLEVLVKGRVSLFKFDKSFYIQKGDTAFYKLTNEEKERIVNGSTYKYNTNRYIGLLNILMSDCDDIKSRITKVKLQEKSITKLIVDYNTLLGSPFNVYKARKPWIKLSGGISGGMVFSMLSFNVKDPQFNYLQGSVKGTFSPLFDLSISILSPRVNERICFQGDLIFYKSRYYSYSLNEGSGSTERNYSTIELSQLKIPLGGRYTFPGKRIIPFVQGGLFFTLNLKSSTDRIREVETNYTVITSHPEMFEISKTQWGCWVGTGFEKKISKRMMGFLELKFDHSFGLIGEVWNPNAPFQSSINCFQIGAGIKMN